MKDKLITFKINKLKQMINNIKVDKQISDMEIIRNNLIDIRDFINNILILIEDIDITECKFWDKL